MCTVEMHILVVDVSVFFNSISTSFSEKVSHYTWCLVLWLDWLTNKLSRSAYLSSLVFVLCAISPNIYLNAMDTNSGPHICQQALYQLSHFPTPQSNF